MYRSASLFLDNGALFIAVALDYMISLKNSDHFTFVKGLFNKTGNNLGLYLSSRKFIFLYIILFVSYFLLFAYLRVEITENATVKNKVRSATADTSLLMLVSLGARGKWKYIIILAPLMISLLVFVNILYSRFFRDMIPASMYFSTIIFNAETFKGALLTYKWFDLILFFIALMPSGCLYFINKKEFIRYRPSISLFLLFGLLGLISGYLTAKTFYKQESNYYKNMSLFAILEHIWNDENYTWIYYYEKMNFTGYVCKIISKFKDRYRHLSSNEKDYIREYLNRGKNDYDNISSNQIKNIIFIVVESFPAKLLELDIGKKIIPTMIGLKNDNKNIYTTINVLAGYGGSSDAQFIYNTGLLPLRNEALVFDYAVKDYPSLAHALKLSHPEINCLEIIGESGKEWNHYQTSRSYGYGNLIDNLATTKINRDSLIFKEAEAQIECIKAPYFIFLTTISMHVPYTNKETTDEIPLLSDSFSPEEKEYLGRAFDFDRQLKNFLDNLKQKNRYRNSLIIITGDHEIPVRGNVKFLSDKRVPLIIINSSKTEVYDREFSQLDVFPSILDIMNLEYIYRGINYQGLGTSIFKESNKTITEEDYKVSEMLIRGNDYR